VKGFLEVLLVIAVVGVITVGYYVKRPPRK
jgi:prepilin-type N-terminal cleavage/methylation domain-containing protein